ncbi:unnamed protein product [Tilletia caries]|uniref:Uncharacterized protein n=1 Tax=Tilletia controversa TaxID=13291 RepID=A0A8X7SSE2_9BASI|nr:hypothetical protein A4X06_0g9140 [Tilletia controversa]CAD6887289.1 unnamed protein product [Tilletia caries]CAD6936556.1 unnamed protein product [Tilletia controversa]
MFTVLDLTPMDDSLKPSIILLHPLLAPYDVDDFSLPINFPVNAQPLLHIHDNHPVIYCNRSSCDVLHNGVPAAKTPRRLRTGNTLHIRSADASKPISATYAVRVAYFSFSSDQRTEAAIGIGRVELGAALALQADTTAHFPLELPIDGKLPAPAPAGTNWDGVRDLVEDVRGRSVEEATRRRQDQASGAGTSSSSALQNPESASFATPLSVDGSDRLLDVTPSSSALSSSRSYCSNFGTHFSIALYSFDLRSPSHHYFGTSFGTLILLVSTHFGTVAFLSSIGSNTSYFSGFMGPVTEESFQCSSHVAHFGAESLSWNSGTFPLQ